MKNLEVVNMGNSAPYPMYFTLRGKDGEVFTKPSMGYDNKPVIRDGKAVIDNFVTGISEITCVHTAPLEVGDTITINKVGHKIEQIVESRKPKGKRFPKDATWYNIICSYTRFTGQAN